MDSSVNFLPSNPMPPDYVRLKNAAIELEAVFLAEMLKSAGLGKTSTSFGGGAGEDQFSSLMVNAHAQQMAKAGGIGLAEVLFESIVKAELSNE